MKKVFIGVGHGGSDPGAVGNGFEEADLNLAIALACSSELMRHGVSVRLSRSKDENDTAMEEVRECNEFDPDVAIDIHINSSVGNSGDGAEVFHTIGGGTGKILAENVLNEITKIGQNSRGIKTRTNSEGKDYYAFIRLTKAPANIIECAFINNKNDIKIIDTPEEQKQMGIAIAKGVLKTLGISFKASNKVDNTPNNYSKEAVEWAVSNGILKGDENGDFKLRENITREDALVFLHRALVK